jgi:hypothetical protein
VLTGSSLSFDDDDDDDDDDDGTQDNLPAVLAALGLPPELESTFPERKETVRASLVVFLSRQPSESKRRLFQQNQNMKGKKEEHAGVVFICLFFNRTMTAMALLLSLSLAVDNGPNNFSCLSHFFSLQIIGAHWRWGSVWGWR